MSDDLIKRLRAAVQTYPQMSEDEPGGYMTEFDQLLDEAANALEAAHEARREAQQHAEILKERLRKASDDSKDAERYRWLAQNAWAMDTVADPDNFVQVWHGTDPACCSYGKTLDAAIDAAIAARNKEEA